MTTAVSRGPGRPRSEEAEKAILEATLDLLRRGGVNGLSIEGVALQAGVAKTTVYRRWSGKTELVVAALAELKGPILQPPGESVRGDLEFLLTRMVLAWDEDRDSDLFLRLAGEADDFPEIAKQFWADVVQPRRQIFFTVLRRGVAEGLIRPEIDVELLAEMMIGPVMSCRIAVGRGGFPLDRVHQLIDIALAGAARS